jgi:predicted transcriptional regulator
MKKLITIYLLILFSAPFESISQNAYVSTQYKEKLIFISAVPTSKYTVIEKVKYSNSKKNEQETMGDVTGMAKVIVTLDEVNEKVSKGKINPYDAVIVFGPLNMELIKFSSDDSDENRKCTVGVKDYSKKNGSKYMFLMSLPLQEYEVVKDIEVSNFTNIGQMKMGKDDTDNFLNKLYERSYKEKKDNNLDFDAIIFDDPEVINKRGFISSKVVRLIKFKP